MITDVDPDASDDICFNTEAFCSLFAETALEAPDVPEFIKKAVDFANQSIWGTLTATIIVHPDSLKDSQTAAAFDGALSDLKYGTVNVNLRAEYGYFIILTTWGGFPGQDSSDIQSGKGVVNNLLMFEHPQKSVVRGRFKMTPDPFSFRNRHFHTFGRKMAYYEASPSRKNLRGLILAALRR